MRSRDAQRGWVLIPMLVMLSLSAVVLRSVIGAATADRRMERAAKERRVARNLLAYGLVRLEAELRERDRSEPGRVRSFELELAVPATLRAPSGWELTGAVHPADPEEWIEVPARYPDDGRPTVVSVPQRYLGDLEREELAEQVFVAVRAAGGSKGRAEWLTTLLIELRDRPSGQSWDAIREAIDTRVERAIVEARFDEADRSLFAESVARLDPLPRLRAHVRHPLRVSGVDRAQLTDPGPALMAGNSGRYRLTVTLARKQRPSRERSRELVLHRRQRWITEENFFAPVAGSLHGWEFDAHRGGTRLGPEAASVEARPWRAMAETSVVGSELLSETGDGEPALPAAVATETAIAGGHGVNGGDPAAVSVRWIDAGSLNAPPLDGSPATWTEVGGRIVHRGRVEWWTAGVRVVTSEVTDDLDPAPASLLRWRPRPGGGAVTLTDDQLRFAPGAESEGTRDVSVSGGREVWRVARGWVLLEERRVRLFDASGDELGRATFGDRLRRAFLDRLDRTLLVASAAGWWAIDLDPTSASHPTGSLAVREVDGPAVPATWAGSSEARSSALGPWDHDPTRDELIHRRWVRSESDPVGSVEESRLGLGPLAVAATASSDHAEATRRGWAAFGRDGVAIRLGDRRLAFFRHHMGRILPDGEFDGPAGEEPFSDFRVQSVPPGIWLFCGSQVGWVGLERAGRSYPDVDGFLTRVPFGESVPRSFEAPLDGSTAGWWTHPSGARSRVKARGTLAAEPSVWRGGDLSDLVVGGALSSPRRGETLRYQPVVDGVGASLPIDAGWGSILVKPTHAAVSCPEPSRERVLLRRTTEGTLRFAPSVAWILAHHPNPPAAVTSSTISGADRPIVVVDELVRRPDALAWSYRRSLVVHGPAWTVQTWGPNGAGSVWSIDSVAAWFPEREVSIPDTSTAGEWSRLAFQWSTEEIQLALDATAGDGTAAWNSDAFTLVSGTFAIDSGGPIAGQGAGLPASRSFDGLFRDLGYDGGVCPPFDARMVNPAVVVSTEAEGRWPRAHCRGVVAPPSVGARWCGGSVYGVVPPSSAIEWRIQPWGDAGGAITAFGRRFRSKLPVAPLYEVELWIHGEPTPSGVPLIEALEVEWDWPAS